MSPHTSDAEPARSYAEAVRRGVPLRNSDGLLEYPTVRSRPAPDFRLGLFHRTLLIGSVVVSLGHTLWMVTRIPSMPQQVPMHFAADGSVNRYGSPWEIAALGAFMAAVIIGCAVLTRYPRIYNLGRHVTELNIQAHYKNNVQLMVWVVVSLAVLHIHIQGTVAGDWPLSPGLWIGMALLLGSVTFFTLRSFRLSAHPPGERSGT
ncbi:DUF1648 domain-containing protein [Nesterenkonia sp.]|uniref:DUF1648 domain-containing protein n=1 Tax=Nesterenkonia sp. TaxID=704201 RepID=UPI00260338A7|nr:DUF1648 domain-containing protein [Nesterenkonia sp.]